jgi:hypothetical protein
MSEKNVVSKAAATAIHEHLQAGLIEGLGEVDDSSRLAVTLIAPTPTSAVLFFSASMISCALLTT